ncbi:acetolactate synthase large subunit [Porticoccaceae bacterium]|nr:acetolactate synthase large subunit [Porticoccaceae bacterium]
MLNGAQLLLQTMLNAGVDTCFTNPGTSEMHFVAALDDAPDMRAVLTLFEGVATGAADGYARMADKPAATLLHLGVGLGNGLANLHNARKARVPVLNIVGDHAASHLQYDSLLQSDIETLASNVSSWIRTSKNTAELSKDALEAIEVASTAPASVATLILPADVSWGEGALAATPTQKPSPPSAFEGTIADIAAVLKQKRRCAILLGGKALSAEALSLAASIANATGAKLFAEAFPFRMAGGGGLPNIERINYDSNQLSEFDELILVEAVNPLVGGTNSINCLALASLSQNSLSSLRELSTELGIKGDVESVSSEPLEPPTGELNIEKACLAIAAMLPENTIISDESNIAPSTLSTYLSKAPRYDLLSLTGDAKGQALPVSIGAAIASPNRPVFVLIDSQNAMHTIQALWTIARENLNVQVLVFNSKTASQKTNTSKLDFAKLSRGMGVSSSKVDSVDSLISGLEKLASGKVPQLVEVELP